MPIYEYLCKKCQHKFELIQKISDTPVKQCPKCLEFTVDKLISAVGFQLKGTGWYVTDFKNKPVSGGASAPTTGTEPTKSADSTTTVPSKKTKSETE